ncbi:MAG: TIGR01777 family oxidoreductase [Lishizhenia sp.]
MKGKIILIAGGTGLVGQPLVKALKKEGNTVRVLSRQASNHQKDIFHWDPSKNEIDENALEGVTHIVNLAGVGIADKRWTKTRKQEIVKSRVEPTAFLFSFASKMPNLEQYVTASGINCYGYDNYSKIYKETDNFGSDYLSQVVQKWEESAAIFSSVCKVVKLRISVVLSTEGGALPKIAQPIKMYFGTALGSGKQWMPWISLNDLVRMFQYSIQHNLNGTFNAISSTQTNKEFTQSLAKVLRKPLWLPNAPGFILKLIFGEMASVVLDGLQASNEKICLTGFCFEDTDLTTTFEKLYS